MSLIYQALKQSEQRTASAHAPAARLAPTGREPHGKSDPVGLRAAGGLFRWTFLAAAAVAATAVVAIVVGYQVRQRPVADVSRAAVPEVLRTDPVTARAMVIDRPPQGAPASASDALSSAPVPAERPLPTWPTSLPDRKQAPLSVFKREPPLPRVSAAPPLSLVVAVPQTVAAVGPAKDARPMNLAARPTVPAEGSAMAAPGRSSAVAAPAATGTQDVLAVTNGTATATATATSAAATPPVAPAPEDLASVFDGLNRALDAKDRGAAAARLATIQSRLPAASVARLRAEAWYAHQTGDLDGARALYRRLLDKSGGDEVSAINLAAIERKSDRADQAKETIRRALRQNPESAALHAALDQLVQGDAVR